MTPAALSVTEHALHARGPRRFGHAVRRRRRNDVLPCTTVYATAYDSGVCRSYWEKAIGETSRHREYGFEETEVPPFVHSWRHSSQQQAFMMSPPHGEQLPPHSPVAAAAPPAQAPAPAAEPRASPPRQHESDPLVCQPPHAQLRGMMLRFSKLCTFICACG